MINPRFCSLVAITLAAAAARLVPHPPNFTPIGAIALFGGAYFARRDLAFLVPLAAMFLSDLLLGLHSLMPVVYGSFVLIVCIGFALRRRRTLFPIAGASLASSVLFYVVTNFGVWAMGAWYPKTVEGLIACYVAAIPFFGNTLGGDALYCTALFGGFALAEYTFPRLREPAAAVA